MSPLDRRAFFKISAAGLAVLAGCQALTPTPALPPIPARLRREVGLAQLACRAASNHNTQPWQFRISADEIEIRPDFSRRCPALDPQDHHLWVSLGCAAENIMLAATDQGLNPAISTENHSICIRLSEGAIQSASGLSRAIAHRQSTRCEYDRHPIPEAWLQTLRETARGDGVEALILQTGAQRDAVEALILEASDSQFEQAALKKELLHWLRFNEAEARASGDGLYSACSGNPTLPSWLGRLAFERFYTADSARSVLHRQLQSASGLILLHAERHDWRQWIASGRCAQRLALQLTALGLKMAFVNQPIEVATSRRKLAAALSLDGRHPEMLLRFGFANPMPTSYRRSLPEVFTPAQNAIPSKR